MLAKGLNMIAPQGVTIDVGSKFTVMTKVLPFIQKQINNVDRFFERETFEQILDEAFQGGLSTFARVSLSDPMLVTNCVICVRPCSSNYD